MSIPEFLRANARFLSAGALLTFLSSFGQTFFIAIFAAEIMAAFQLSDGEWGGIYTVATATSAVVMLWAGALADRFRVRQLVCVVVPGLAITCVAMALNAWLPALFLVIFLLRLFGQGMCSQLAATAMARWFAGRRGLALSISAMGFSFGQAVLPVLIASLLLTFSWRWIWAGGALMIIVCIPFLLMLLSAERTPSALANEVTSSGMEARHWTRGEVLRSPVFWLLLPMLLGPPAWGSAMFFQQVHIAAVKGWPLIEYLALIPLLTLVGVISTVVSGQMIDRFGSGSVARVYLFPFVVTFLVVGYADSIGTAAIGMVFFGIGHGMMATLPMSFSAEYFGTRHIGAIKSVSTSIMVLGSAIGPGVSGLFIDLGYSFPDQMLAIAVYFVLSIIFVWLAVARANRALATS